MILSASLPVIKNLMQEALKALEGGNETDVVKA
jgi:hypothetical protein